MEVEIERLELPPHAIDTDHDSQRCDVVREGRRVAVRKWGDGPPLILFHGGHGTWMHWLRNVGRLSAVRSLYLVDLPGFGESFRCEFGTMAGYAAMLEPFLAELAPYGRIAIGGFSFGSTVAAHLCEHFRDRVERLVMVGSPSLTTSFDSTRDRLARWRTLDDPAERRRAHEANLRLLMLRPNSEIAAGTVSMQETMAALATLRYRSGNTHDSVGGSS